MSAVIFMFCIPYMLDALITVGVVALLLLAAAPVGVCLMRKAKQDGHKRGKVHSFHKLNDDSSSVS